MFFTKNSKNSDKIYLWRWFLHKSELYFVSYSSRSITCVFDINEPKSYQNRSKVSLWPHILTQFDEIYRLVYDLTIYDELFFGCFFTSRDLYVEKSTFFHLSKYGQIIYQSIDLVELSKNVRSKWYFWKTLNSGIYCLKKWFLINNQFFSIIIDYKISF